MLILDFTIGQTKAFSGQNIGILVSYRNGAIYQKNEQTSIENKEVELVEAVQMNIYQSNTYGKDLNQPHFDDEPWAQVRDQVKDQQSNVSLFVVYLTFPSSIQALQPRYGYNIACKAVWQVYRDTEQPQKKEEINLIERIRLQFS